MTNVILVDEQDIECGVMPKLDAHRAGKLHRAFSVFIVNSKGEMLIQKRADDKYHSGGLWTNACCSHPRPGETVLEAAHTRLPEEIGFDCELTEIFSFIYKVQLDGGMTEHEYDHVLVGIYDKDPVLNPDEASDFAWVDVRWLVRNVEKNPGAFTYWLKKCLGDVAVYLEKSRLIQQTQEG